MKLNYLHMFWRSFAICIHMALTVDAKNTQANIAYDDSLEKIMLTVISDDFCWILIGKHKTASCFFRSSHLFHIFSVFLISYKISFGLWIPWRDVIRFENANLLQFWGLLNAEFVWNCRKIPAFDADTCCNTGLSI